MSHTTSRSGSEASARSSLKGWNSGPTPATPLSHDEEASRTTSSPYSNLTAAIDPKALRPNSSPCLGPQERIWWSEQTLFEVQKMELALKQDLHKTTAGLREQFRRQMEPQPRDAHHAGTSAEEVERNEAQQRSAAMDRALSRLREDFEAFSQQDPTSRLRTISDNQAQAEASVRLELDAMRCSMEDLQRHCAEELSMRLATFDAEKEQLLTLMKKLSEDDGVVGPRGSRVHLLRVETWSFWGGWHERWNRWLPLGRWLIPDSLVFRVEM
eukprot:g28713.t1